MVKTYTIESTDPQAHMSEHEDGRWVSKAELERIEAVLTELERPSVIRAAIRAAGDPDMEWWNKGWTAAVKRMRAAFDGEPK